MMRRYFYTSGPLLSQWIEKNTMLRRFEDEFFRSAMLAAHRLNQSLTFSQLYDKIIEMTISQQMKYANNHHIQCIFRQFSTLNQATKLKNMVIDNSKSNIKDLVDPDKFPIWDLRQSSPVYSQIWGFVMGRIRQSLGFQLVVRQSSVEHPEGGRGVKVILSRQRKSIEPGQFIGFVPGTIYEHYNSYKKYRLDRVNKYEKSPMHLHFPSGKILELGEIPLAKYDFNQDAFKSNEQKLRQVMVDPSYMNPYALGHMINHPPPGEQQNVCFSEIYIDKRLFPQYYLRYIPYVNSLNGKQKKLRLFGIFALKRIKNRQQLFVNYLQNHIYPIDKIPEWYIKPNRFSEHYEYLSKRQYELPTRNYWSWLENKYMERNKELYNEFLQKTTFQPGNIVYEDNTSTVRKIQVPKYSKNNQFQ